MDISTMMIVAKYFSTPRDYINVIRLNRKYAELIEMYKYNPISDWSLFPNIQTQHFYKNSDFENVNPSMYRYIYWGTFNYETESAVKKVNSRRYKVNKYDDKEFVKDKCISKDMTNRIVRTLVDKNFRLGEKIFDSIESGFDTPILSGNVIEVFQDSWNNQIAIMRGVDNLNGSDFISVPCLLGLCYIDNENNVKLFRDNDDLKLRSTSNKVILIFNKSKSLTFQCKIVKKQGTPTKMWMNISNSGFTYDELRNLMFKNSIICQGTPNLIRFLVRRYTIYKLENDFNDNYYKQLLGKNWNVIFDTWNKPYIPEEYNIGYVRYVYLDRMNNIMAFSIFPTEVIITTVINGKTRIFKPRTKMVEFVNSFDTNLYLRYNFKEWFLSNFYNEKRTDMISPLKEFESIRLLITTNPLTRCSCVNANKYFLKVVNGNYENY